MRQYFIPFSIIILSSFSYGEEIQSLPSYQGFKGLINTPNAEVIPEGEFGLLYNTQVDNFFPSLSPDFRDDKNQRNYLLNMGVLPNLDFSLRFADGKDSNTNLPYASDRILSFKYQLPFIPKDIAKVSLGMQDMGGGRRYMPSSYLVTSKTFQNFRTSLGYAKGSEKGSLDGVFGGVEYQPFSWVQLSGEYDTREWNMALKTFYNTTLGRQPLTLGAMVKSSLDYTEPYFGFFAYVPLYDKSKVIKKTIKRLPKSEIIELEQLGLSNLSKTVKEDSVHISYENTLYSYNDIDALGMVLGIVATSNIAPNIVITIKKSDIAYQTVTTNTKEYKTFLKTGNYRSGLLRFYNSQVVSTTIKHSDQFRPLISLQPALRLVDGSEYGEIDYSLSLQAEASMRLAKGTIINTRVNIPVNETNNFKKDAVFDYRARDRGEKIEIDQLLLSQYLQIDTPTPWIHLLQVGQFEKELTGVSYESAISDSSGKHQLMLKVANLKDNIYSNIDWYHNTSKREERLLSYRYYWENLNSNIKFTAGQFLYGDKGVNFTLKRYFSDLILQLDLGRTDHELRGESNIGRLSLSIPFGPKKRIKTAFVDIKGGDFTYQKRKNIVTNGEVSYAKPFHTEEVSNSFSLENYYLNRGRFQPSYIKTNHNRLRNIFLEVNTR
jgi:hypothetical protein